MQTTVSIAMATCNGEKHLAPQLESLADQQRLPDELVVCDDCSDDGTRQVLERFAAGAPFAVRIHRNERRLGITKNFEKAFRLCTGSYIFPADQDDVWHAEKIALLADFLDCNAGVGLVFCNAAVTDEKLAPRGSGLWEALWFSKPEQRKVAAGRAFEVFLRHAVAAGMASACRASLRDLFLPIPDLWSCHDAWVALIIAAVSEVAIIDRPLVSYRVHGGNQIGIRKPGLLQQLRLARRQVSLDLFRYSLELHTAARERLRKRSPRSGFSPHERVPALLEDKIMHARARAELPAGLPGRLTTVAREAARGRYRRYSYGLKSILQDLFLR